MSETLDQQHPGTSASRKPRRKPPAPGAGKTRLRGSLVDARDNLHPAICYLRPDEMGDPEAWRGYFARASAMGFDTVLLATPFKRVNELVVDYDSLGDASGGGEALPALSEAAQSGLALMLDLDITRIASIAPLVDAHPDWFTHADDGAAFRLLAENDATVDWWDQQIGLLQSAGIAGFRCLAASSVAPGVWTRLLRNAHARQPQTRFLAWTPGSAAEAVVRLAGCGFDYGFSSSCWWDFKAGWLNDDAARIARIGPALALTNPLEGDFTGNEPMRRRALRFAALYGAGWLMPMGFELGLTAQGTLLDLADEVLALNKLRNRNGHARSGETARLVSSPESSIAVLRKASAGESGLALAVNSEVAQNAEIETKVLATLLNSAKVEILETDGASRMLPPSLLQLSPGEVALLHMADLPPIKMAPPPVGLDLPRIAIEAIDPKVDDGEFPVRRVVGETVEVSADIIADGHDKLAAELLWRSADEDEYHTAPMTLVANDRWRGEFPLERIGRHVYAVAAWKDLYATFVDEVSKKHAAGIPTSLELQEGVELIRATAEANPRYQAPLKTLLEQIENLAEEARRGVMLSDEAVALMRAADRKKFLIRSGQVAVDAERPAARFASWYEVFPRSMSGDPSRHGTFQDVIRQLPRIAGMGFDVLYFPPIHPIGRINRKGRDNSLTAGPDDPGSPYAIGSSDGGHDALHPELGTLADFHALRDAAAGFGIELALDFAIQCAPDHPWIKEHPEWFDWRPDGSLRYAENPPKKYEDIVNVDFYAPGAMPSLWLALRDIVQFWVDQGIRLFRVDNPHTKPLPFWQWMIADIRGRHPDVVFLAEAFTRPKLMYRLAKIGFSQSYTYFTWRNTKEELTEYLTELNQPPVAEFFGPHFFVNTPDINPLFLHHSGRPGFLIRAALGATLSGLWGVYNGFELCEDNPIPGKEEYRNSEKYEIKAWDYERPGNIVAEISRLNAIRRDNTALHSHLGLEFLNAFNDQVLYFFKRSLDGNAILVAVSLDPFNPQTAQIEIPLWRFGLPDHGSLAAEDLMRDVKFTWHGKMQSVWLNPYELPFCIWRVHSLT